jgi:hypothetical protein
VELLIKRGLLSLIPGTRGGPVVSASWPDSPLPRQA